MKKFLKRLRESFRYGEKGFTLIELLIVIVILGVLAAAIIPNLSKFVGSGTVGAANAELASVRTAFSAYTADNVTAALAVTEVSENTTWITSYIQGGIKGVYAVNGITGSINGTSYPGGLSWDATNKKWFKP